MEQQYAEWKGAHAKRGRSQKKELTDYEPQKTQDGENIFTPQEVGEPKGDVHQQNNT